MVAFVCAEEFRTLWNIRGQRICWPPSRIIGGGKEAPAFPLPRHMPLFSSTALRTLGLLIYLDMPTGILTLIDLHDIFTQIHVMYPPFLEVTPYFGHVINREQTKKHAQIERERVRVRERYYHQLHVLYDENYCYKNV